MDGPKGLEGLVRSAQAGDRDAFEELVRLTHSEVFALAYRLTGDRHDAADVVQEAYLRAFRGLRRFRSEASFATWMHRITVNCASTHRSGKGRRRHQELERAAELPDPGYHGDPEARASAQAGLDRVADAVAALPPRLRAVVVLRDVYDLPHEAIAAELGISATAAKVRLHRARKQLRGELFPLRRETAPRAGTPGGTGARVV